MIYTGKKKIGQDVLPLSQEVFGGNPNKPEFKARIIHGEYKGGIIEEYMGEELEFRRSGKNEPGPDSILSGFIEGIRTSNERR